MDTAVDARSLGNNSWCEQVPASCTHPPHMPIVMCAIWNHHSTRKHRAADFVPARARSCVVAVKASRDVVACEQLVFDRGTRCRNSARELGRVDAATPSARYSTFVSTSAEARRLKSILGRALCGGDGAIIHSMEGHWRAPQVAQRPMRRSRRHVD